MAYPYNGQLSPTVGGGMGGLPTRQSSGQLTTKAAYQYLLSKNLVTPPVFGSVFKTTLGNGAISCVSLDSSTVLCTYNGTSQFLEAVVLKISSSGIITAGSVTVCNAVAVNISSVCKLSASKALVTYELAATGILWAVILDISDTVVTANTAVQVATAAVNDLLSCVASTSTQGIVIYYDAGILKAVALNVSGSTITVGTISSSTKSFGGAAMAIKITKLTDTTFLVVFPGVSNFLSAVVLSISGSTISWGTAVSNTVACSEATVVALTPTTALCITAVSGSSPYYTFISITDTTIALSTTTSFTDSYISAATKINIARLSNTSAIFTAKATTSTFTCFISTSGTLVTLGQSVSPNAMSITSPVIAELSSETALLVFGGASTYLNAVQLVIPGN